MNDDSYSLMLEFQSWYTKIFSVVKLNKKCLTFFHTIVEKGKGRLSSRNFLV